MFYKKIEIVILYFTGTLNVQVPIIAFKRCSNSNVCLLKLHIKKVFIAKHLLTHTEPFIRHRRRATFHFLVIMK